MIDLNVRELEERALTGDRAALESLRAWWRRQGDPGDGTALLLAADQLAFAGVLGPGLLFETDATPGRLRVERLSLKNRSVDSLAVEVWVAEDFLAIRGRVTDLPPSGAGPLVALSTFRPEIITYDLAPGV